MRIRIYGQSVWVNFHHLYCFYSAANLGGLTQASKDLGIGQSALSIQIKQLERQLGFTVFDRTHRKLTLNERGKVVFLYAKEIFRLGNEMIETLSDQGQSHKTHLQVGALDTIPKHLTVRLVTEAIRKHQCIVSVTEGRPEDLVTHLAEHRLDLAVMNFIPSQEPGRLISKRIAKNPLWVIGARRFLPLRRRFPRSLSGQPMVVPTGDSQVRHAIDNHFSLRGLSPTYVAEAQDVMVQKLLAIQGVGLTVAPEFAILEYIERGELFRIGRLEGVYDEHFLISAKRRVRNPVAADMMAHFKV